MLKIRDFARLGEVSVTTLRYYDEIGLLKPIRVDPETGYRFYTMDQLPRLHRILALKELGLGLAQIVQLLDEGVSPEALQGMLRLRQADLQQRIQGEQEQLTRIEARLKYIEQGGGFPAYEVVLKAVKPTTAVSLRLSWSELAHKWEYSSAFLDLVKQHGVKPIDHLLMLYHESGDVSTGDIENELEIAVPVESRDADALVEWSGGRVARCELPAVPRMASTLYRGNPYTMIEPLHALGTWMETNGYTIIGPRRGVYLQRGDNPDDSLIEIQFPVEKMCMDYPHRDRVSVTPSYPPREKQMLTHASDIPPGGYDVLASTRV
jgi:DNA-binding transcriptional MerR regulator/effector-binding domain-containing protein